MLLIDSMKHPESLRLRALRVALKLSQAEFAELCGVGRATIARSELGAAVSPTTIASIAGGIRVDAAALLAYFEGATPLLDIVNAASIDRSRIDSNVSPDESVNPGELANVAAAVFRTGEYSLQALDVVRQWLSEIERSGNARVLEDAEIAEQVTEQLFAVASAFGGSRMDLTSALLRVAAELVRLAEPVSPELSPREASMKRRERIRASRIASTKQRYATLLERASQWLANAPDEQRRKLSSRARRFIAGDMHDAESGWSAVVEELSALGLSNTPF